MSDIAALYREPPEAFVAAREALVKTLRAANQREAAAQVHALARPSVAAWAANQIADAAGVGRLVEAGATLLAAQRHAIEHGDASGIRAAQTERRQQVRALADAAVEFLVGDGRNGEGQRAELVAIFEAVSVDPAAAAELLAGRLAKRPEAPSGFDLVGAGLEVSARDLPAPRPKPARAARPGPAEPPGEAAANATAVGEAAANVAEAEAPSAELGAARALLAAASTELERATQENAAAASALLAADAEALVARDDVAELSRRLADATEQAERLALVADNAAQRVVATDTATSSATTRFEAARALVDELDQRP